MISIDIKEQDSRAIMKMISRLRQLNNYEVHVGIFASEEDATLLMIARVHEYGVEINVTPKMRAFLAYQGLPLKKSTTTINIPERSYFRTTYYEERENLFKMLEKGVIDILNNQTTAKITLERIGIYLQSQIQEMMVNVREPPNHPFTINRKGSSNPLIDRGQLRQAITYKIVKR